MLVPFPLAASNDLISFLTFQISTFLSACSADSLIFSINQVAGVKTKTISEKFGKSLIINDGMINFHHTTQYIAIVQYAIELQKMDHIIIHCNNFSQYILNL